MPQEDKYRVLTVTRSPGGWAFVPVHYSADPEKDDAWALRERNKYPNEDGYARELEIDFGLHSGTPAYPAFSEGKHVVDELAYDDRLPFLLAMDFNTNPMSLIICHLENGWLKVIDEIVQAGTIDQCIQEFRNRYPMHRGDVTFYGDATRGTNPQTAKSNWLVVQMSMRGYCVKPQYLVPFSNPGIGDRLLAVNRKLQGAEGVPGIHIASKCRELIQDFREVMLTPDGKRILKVNKPEDPYYLRTHASDAIGYLIAREWPVIKEVFSKRPPRKPLKKDHLYGETFGVSHPEPETRRETGLKRGR